VSLTTHAWAARSAGPALTRGRAALAQDLNSTRLDDLSAEEKQTLAQWAEKFRAKYPVVGSLRPSAL
jgi:hypothetical protein